MIQLHPGRRTARRRAPLLLLLLSLLLAGCASRRPVSLRNAELLREDAVLGEVALNRGSLHFRSREEIAATLTAEETGRSYADAYLTPQYMPSVFRTDPARICEILQITKADWVLPADLREASPDMGGLTHFSARSGQRGATPEERTAWDYEIFLPQAEITYTSSSQTEYRRYLSVYAKYGAFEFVDRVFWTVPVHFRVGAQDSRVGDVAMGISWTMHSAEHPHVYEFEVAMTVGDTGYWIECCGLTQEELCAFLLSVVNAPRDPSRDTHAALTAYLYEVAAENSVPYIDSLLRCETK